MKQWNSENCEYKETSDIFNERNTYSNVNLQAGESKYDKDKCYDS